MYSLALLMLLVGQYPALPKSLAIPRSLMATIATPLEQQDLQQLRLEKQIQKQVREEIDRTLDRIVVLLCLVLIFALSLPLVSLGFYWFIQRKLTLEITKAVQSLAQLSADIPRLEPSHQSISQPSDRSTNQVSDQSISQPSHQSISQISDRSNFLSDLTLDAPLDQSQHLEQISAQGQDTINPRDQDREKLSHLPSVVATKEKIMEELISHLPPLSQEKIFAGQEAKLVNLIQQLTILLEDYPDLPLAVQDYTNHAHALYFLGQELPAIALYNHSLDLEPEQPHAWHQKGTIHLKQAEYQEAIAAYNQALNLQADYASSWYKLAYSYALMGELDLALNHLQRAINLNPSYRTRARMSPDFQMLKESDRFQSLVNLEPPP